MPAHKGNKYRQLPKSERKVSLTFRALPAEVKTWKRKAKLQRKKLSPWIVARLNASGLGG
jgi:hypothetical protein